MASQWRKFFYILWLAAAVPVLRAEETLVVGMELSYPPFEMTGTDNKPKGVSVDLAGDLAKALGRPLRIENIPFDGLIPALKTGKIDIILSSMTATDQRARSIDFSQAYLQTGLALFLNAKTSIEGVRDLDKKGLKVAVKKGTTGHQYASKNLKKATLLVLDKEAAAVLEVLQGKADAFIYDQLSVYRHNKRHPERSKAELAAFQHEYWAIGVRKGRPELLNQINAFLKDYRSKGGFTRLSDKWLSEEKKAFEERKIPFIF